jgi:hypothetical protein
LMSPVSKIVGYKMGQFWEKREGGDGGTSGAPTHFPPVCVWLSWAGKAAAWDIARPL